MGSQVAVLAAIERRRARPGRRASRVPRQRPGCRGAGRQGPGPQRSGRAAHGSAHQRRALAAARVVRDPGQRREPPVDSGGGVEAPADRGRGPPAQDRRAGGQGVRWKALGLRGCRSCVQSSQARGDALRASWRLTLAVVAVALAGCAVKGPQGDPARVALLEDDQRPSSRAARESRPPPTHSVDAAFAERGQVVLAMRSGLIEELAGTWPEATWIA